MGQAVIPSSKVQVTPVGTTTIANPIIVYTVDGASYSSAVEYYASGASRRYLYPVVSGTTVNLVAFDIVFGTAIPAQSPVVQIFAAA